MDGYYPVHVSGPLEQYAVGFQEELAALGYTPFSARGQVGVAAHLSRWMEIEGLDASALSEEVAERYLVFRRAAGYTFCRSVRYLAPLLRYLRGSGVVAQVLLSPPQTPVEAVLDRFRGYLLEERGMTAAGARGYLDAVRPFLAGCERGGEVDLAGLCAADVTRFVLAESKRLRPKTVQRKTSALRSLLNYLHVSGLIASALTGAVPSAANRGTHELPRYLEPDQVRALLAGCDRAGAQGRRDYAVLLLMVRMGLRCGEVAGLTLEDLDWRAGQVRIRGKGNRADLLPLPVDVAEAVVAYLWCGRPAAALDRSVFIRVKAPARGLTAPGMTQIVVGASKRAGLDQLTGHRLRHTAATDMLRAGAPLQEIAQVLRHQRIGTSAIYAKVDAEALRTLARRWPGGPG
jgi:integrase/recombinase XerD